MPPLRRQELACVFDTVLPDARGAMWQKEGRQCSRIAAVAMWKVVPSHDCATRGTQQICCLTCNGPNTYGVCYVIYPTNVLSRVCDGCTISHWPWQVDNNMLTRNSITIIGRLSPYGTLQGPGRTRLGEILLFMTYLCRCPLLLS